MIHCLRTIDYCFWFSFFTTYLCKFSSKKLFLHFLDNDDRMSSKRRNLSALVFLINHQHCSQISWAPPSWMIILMH